MKSIEINIHTLHQSNTTRMTNFFFFFKLITAENKIKSQKCERNQFLNKIKTP